METNVQWDQRKTVKLQPNSSGNETFYPDAACTPGYDSVVDRWGVLETVQFMVEVNTYVLKTVHHLNVQALDVHKCVR